MSTFDTLFPMPTGGRNADDMGLPPANALGLISIHQAAARGIDRLRKPIWANPLDHLKIDLLGDHLGRAGPWVHLYAPFNKECNGRDPVDVFCLDVDFKSEEYVPYTGALPDSEEYKADVAKYVNKRPRL